MAAGGDFCIRGYVAQFKADKGGETNLCVLLEGHRFFENGASLTAEAE